MDFWRALDHMRGMMGLGPEGVQRAQAELRLQSRRLSETALVEPGLFAARRSVLEAFCKTYGLTPDPALGLRTETAPKPGIKPASASSDLDRYVQQVRPGVSLVTCCRDRNENLLLALPSWLAQTEIDEIVIVDFTSATPVSQTLREAGIDDPRIVVARVEDEPRWVLSYAFNIGFRIARHETIIKADADIVLEPGFCAAHRPKPGQFIAGNWRLAAKGQEFVNGFFQVARGDLLAIKGFNEYILGYGWDDDDLYARLLGLGLTRRDVAPDTLHHLDHADSARMPTFSAKVDCAKTALDQMPMFHIRTNRQIAGMMPGWDGARRLTPYKLIAFSGREVLLRRAGPPPHRVPDHILRMAEAQARAELLSWRTSQRAYDLRPDQCEALLSLLPLDQIGALHVDLKLAGADETVLRSSAFLVCDLSMAEVYGDLSRHCAKLNRLAKKQGRCLVLRVPTALLAFVKGAGLRHPVLPVQPWLARLVDARKAELAAKSGEPFLRLIPDSPPAAPAVTCQRERIFVDAQHGLGNRLRAIGSAAAIAQESGRQLVILWQPDHHCEGRFSDLFRYDGAVIEASFPDQAASQGATLFNYMEVEPGGAKNAPILLEPGRDAYLRSAYVFNHPFSRWTRENIFLRSLRPSADVEGLIASAADHRDIGLHIRMEGGGGAALKSYDSAENWPEDGHKAIVHWREASHYSRFRTRIDALLQTRPEAKLFLAADLPETYQALANHYGPRIAMLERGVYDRSAKQLQFALADMLLLARCQHFLGSHWSSFSEGALRLSTSIQKKEMSGLDF